MQDVDLPVGPVGTHDVLFDGLAHPNVLDEVVERRLGIFPFLWWDDFDDAGLHSVAINLFHLEIEVLAGPNAGIKAI